MAMNLYWRDLEEPANPNEWRGLELTVHSDARAGFTVDACPPSYIRIATNARPLVWVRIDDDYYGYQLLRSSQRASPAIISPVSFQTVEENARGDRATFHRAWARTYAKMLAQSESSPLVEGRWYLGHDLRQSTRGALEVDLLRKIVKQDSHGYVNWAGHAPYPIMLREPSPRDDGRVHAWRKHARAGSLPPIILYWISGLCAHVILDGHDRALAAALENVPAPALFLEALQKCEVDEGTHVIFEAVAHALGTGESDTVRASIRPRSAHHSLTIQNANRLLLNAFAPGVVAAPTRAGALRGGVEAWSREVSSELALQKLLDSNLLDDMRETDSGA
jgi:hypothetical protein